MSDTETRDAHPLPQTMAEALRPTHDLAVELERQRDEARAELSRLRAVLEAVQAVRRKLPHGLDGGIEPEYQRGYEHASDDIARRLDAALAPVSSSGEAGVACRCVTAPAQCPVHPVSSGEAESGEAAHPEDFCQRCGGRNVKPWFAPSDVWNAVVGDEWSIICPQCFVELAERSERFADEAWELRPTIRYPAPVLSGGQAESGEEREGEGCWCYSCDAAAPGFICRTRMNLCPDCGNKRCPRATWHGHRCTGSNEAGQPGSIYGGQNAPAPSGHVLTEYGTTDCTVERVRAFVDDGVCSACGAPVPSEGQADGEGDDLTDADREAQRLGRCGPLRYGGPCWLVLGHRGPHHCYREDVDVLAARPVLSREALRKAVLDGLRAGWRDDFSAASVADTVVDHLADVLAGEQR